MKTGWLLVAALLLVAPTSSGSAKAQTIAYAAPGVTNVREGPGTQYRIIGRVWGGERLYVDGCLSDYSWCRVTVGRLSGWMAAFRMQFVYGGRRVFVPYYYRYFGAPIITFHIGRPWYWPRPWPRPTPRPNPPSKYDPRCTLGHPGCKGPGPELPPGYSVGSPRVSPPVTGGPGPGDGVRKRSNRGDGGVSPNRKLRICPEDNPNCR